MKTIPIFIPFLLLLLLQSCEQITNPNDKMVEILATKYRQFSVKENPFCPDAELVFFDSLLKAPSEINNRLSLLYIKAIVF